MEASRSNDYIQYIDLDKALIEKSPKLYKRLPKFVIAALKKIVHQQDLNDDLNELVRNNMRGTDFFVHFLRMKNITTRITNPELLPKDGKYIFVSNHPLGGLDGISMIASLGQYYPNIRFIVNDLLLHLPNTAPVFVPVNKHGANSRDYLRIMDETFADERNQMLIYPAGMVSRKQNGKIQDLAWQKSFISKATQYQRDIVPLYFTAANSNFFYNLALIRKKLGIKANIEMLFLVHELYKQRNANFTITVGEKIPYTTFDNSKKPDQWAQYVKDIVYQLPAKTVR